MDKRRRLKAAELFADPNRPLTFGWLSQVLPEEKPLSREGVRRDYPDKRNKKKYEY